MMWSADDLPEDLLRQAGESLEMPEGMRARILAASARALHAKTCTHQASWALLFAGPLMWLAQLRAGNADGGERELMANATTSGFVADADPFKRVENWSSSSDRALSASLHLSQDADHSRFAEWELVEQSTSLRQWQAGEVRRFLS